MGEVVLSAAGWRFRGLKTPHPHPPIRGCCARCYPCSDASRRYLWLQWGQACEHKEEALIKSSSSSVCLSLSRLSPPPAPPPLIPVYLCLMTRVGWAIWRYIQWKILNWQRVFYIIIYHVISPFYVLLLSVKKPTVRPLKLNHWCRYIDEVSWLIILVYYNQLADELPVSTLVLSVQWATLSNNRVC